MYVAGFALLIIDASFISLAVVRFVQLVAMQGLANSAWETMINVTPPERRDQARAFINGLPAQAGTALAGVLLLAGEESLGPSVLFTLGLLLALLATFASWRAKRGYPGAVVETLRTGRPHVFDASPLSLVDAAAIDAVTLGGDRSRPEGAPSREWRCWVGCRSLPGTKPSGRR